MQYHKNNSIKYGNLEIKKESSNQKTKNKKQKVMLIFYFFGLFDIDKCHVHKLHFPNNYDNKEQMLPITNIEHTI